jgi:hypothetical protein
MTETLKQKFIEEIIKLPKTKQDAINSMDWIEITNEVGKNYLLNESDVEILQVETGLVMIGFVGLEMYALNIENNVGTTTDESKKIAKDIFDKIFLPLTNKMEVSVKNRLETKIPHWNETVNFIISGGDYSNFMEK